MPDFGIFRGFGEKLFGDKLVAGQLPTQLGLIGSESFGFDIDAKAFFARVTAAGGSLSGIEETAINTLVKQMKLDGIWTKMKAIYPMVGASAAACAQNLKSSSFTGTFTSGWTFASSGVTPNGTSAYMDTNLNYNSVIGLNSTHYSFYSRSNTTKSAFDMGCYAGGQENWMTTNYGLRSYYHPNTSGVSLPYENTIGYYLGTFTINSIKFFKNASLIASKTSTTYNSTNLNVFLGAVNQGSGTPLFFADRQCAFASIGDGLTDTEASDFYTAVQAFNTTLSRQV